MFCSFHRDATDTYFATLRAIIPIYQFFNFKDTGVQIGAI